MTAIAFRLHFRTADDSADAFVVSTVPGVGEPYLQNAPTGDGTKTNPFTGVLETGGYSARVLDVETSPGVRLITSRLEEDGRGAWIGRKVVTMRRDGTGPWVTTLPLYVTDYELDGALTWVFALGDGRRVEQRARAFAPRVIGRNLDGTAILEPEADFLARWPVRGALVGGPIRLPPGGTLPDGLSFARSFAGWKVRVAARASIGGTAVDQLRLDLLEGYYSPRYEPVTAPGDGRLLAVANGATEGFWAEQPDAAITGATGGTYVAFPDLRVVIGSDVYRFGDYRAVFGPPAESPGVFATRDTFTQGPSGAGSLLARVPGALGTLALNSTPRVHVLSLLPTAASPLYVTAHPVDLDASLLVEAGIDFDPASVAPVRAALGEDLRMTFRITEPEGLLPFQQRLRAVFGYGVRPSGGGWEYVAMRPRLRPTPTRTLTLADCADPGQVWKQSDKTAYSQVVLEVQRLSAPSTRRTAVPIGETRPSAGPDGILVQRETVERVTGDALRVGARTLALALPGYIHAKNASPDGSWTATYGTRLAREVWDRTSVGIRELAFTVLATSDVAAAQIGDEVIVDVPHLPNGNLRRAEGGAARIAQVVQRTPGVATVELVLWDSGALAQPATTPTFTLAAGARRGVAHVTLTNGSALDAIGAHVRLQVVQTPTGTATPPGDGAGMDVVYPAGQLPAGVAALPPTGRACRLYVRARSEAPDLRPGTWGAWAWVELAGLPVVTSLVGAAVSGDGTRATLTWTLPAGLEGALLDVLVEASGDARQLVDTLPAGSTRYTATGLLPATAYSLSVQARDPVTGDTSDLASVSVTTSGAPATLAPPTTPTGWSGAPRGNPALAASASVTGDYGIAVVAATPGALVVVEEAVETSVGSGSYGAWRALATVASDAQDWTIVGSVAPSDGLRRRLRAAHQTAGSDTLSAWTTAVTVTPWVRQVLGPIPPASGGGTPLERITALAITPNVGAGRFDISWSLDPSISGATMEGVLEVLDQGFGVPVGYSGGIPLSPLATTYTPTWTLASAPTGGAVTMLARLTVQAMIGGISVGARIANVAFYNDNSGA